MKNKIKVLFFIDGSVATEAEKKEAFSLMIPVGFRNRVFISDSDRVEKCDCVGGKIPNQYKHLPLAKDYIKTQLKLEDSQKEPVKPAPPVEKPKEQKEWKPNTK